MNEWPDAATSDRNAHECVKLLLALNSYPGVMRWNYFYLYHKMSKWIEQGGEIMRLCC